MRTQINDFVISAAAQLEAQGLAADKAKVMAERLQRSTRCTGFDEVPDGSTVFLSINGEDQRVALVHERIVISQALPEGDDLLVEFEPTARQVELCDAMRDAMTPLYAAIGDAVRAGVEDPHSAPEVVRLRAAYDALVAESVAINPFVSGWTLDPELAGTFSDYYKHAYGSRPRGYHSLSEMRDFVSNPPNCGGFEDDIAA